ARGEFHVVGVVRLTTKEDRKQSDPMTPWELREGNVFVPPAAGERLFARLPWAKDAGFHSAEVRVRPGSDVAAATAAIEGMGFEAMSMQKWFNNAKREVTLIAAGLN